MTIEEIFPGNVGRLVMARVILRLRMPELARMARNATVSPTLESQLRAAIDAVKKG